MPVIDWHFGNPWWGLLFLFIPLIILFRSGLRIYRRKVLNVFSSKTLRPYVVRNRSTAIFVAKTLALCGFWGCLTLALMNPQGHPHFAPGQGAGGGGGVKRQQPEDVIFLIDASASMTVKDGRNGMNRFDTAKEIAELLIQELKGQNVAIYAFTSDASLLVPPTPDYLYSILQLRQMQINEGGAAGTDLSEALQAVLNQAKKDTTLKKHTLVLISDGGDNELEEPTKEQTRIKKVLKAIAELKEKDWDFYVIGVGSPQGAIIPDLKYKGQPVYSKLDERLLKEIVEASKGEYFTENSAPPLQLAKRVGEDIIAGNKGGAFSTAQSSRKLVYKDYYQIFLTISLAFLLFAWLYPETVEKES